MNTSAPLFNDENIQTIVDKQKAELYMQIYQYAAEDFFTNQDMQSYHMMLSQYFLSVEMQLSRLMAIIANHTHIIPPHTHPIVGPAACMPSIPFSSLMPVQAASMVWTQQAKPQLKWTTKVPPNLGMNYVIQGVASEGILSPGLRRALPIPLTLKPTVPPVLKGSLTE